MDILSPMLVTEEERDLIMKTRKQIFYDEVEEFLRKVELKYKQKSEEQSANN